MFPGGCAPSWFTECCRRGSRNDARTLCVGGLHGRHLNRRHKLSSQTRIAKQYVHHLGGPARKTSRPTSRAAGIPQGKPTPKPGHPHHRGEAPTTNADFHPPSMCARHPPAGRRPNPATNKRRPTIPRQVAPTARRRRVKGPPQATHRRGHADTGGPKSFWEKVRSKAVTSTKEPHTGEVRATEHLVRLEDTRTLAHDGQTCSQPYTRFIGQKRARGSSRRVGRFGDFYSEPKSVKSPESA